MGHFELIIFAFVVIGWIIRTIFRGLKWMTRQIKTVGVAPSPIQQAIAEAQRQQTTALTPAPRPQAPRPQAAVRPNPQPRRPDAGGPAVPREATRADLDRAEREMQAWEPSGLDTPLRSSAPAQTAAPFTLFQDTDDLVRAVILQEALGPPLSRRASR